MYLTKTLNFLFLGAVFLVKLNPCEADEHGIIFREDDHIDNSNSSSGNPPVIGIKEPDSCAAYNPPVPDFSRPGRRISSVKCYEYIWQMKDRSEKARRKRQCEITKRQMAGKERIAVPQILGGRYTLRGEFPNMGAIGWKAVIGTWVFMCGSSLISPKFVLTAAHCSSASSRDTTIVDTVPKIVRLGQRSIMDTFYTKDQKPVDMNIIRIITHPDHKPPKQYFDLALMELGTEVKFTSEILPACLWGEPRVKKYGSKAQIAGWGVVRSGSREMSSELMVADVDIIGSEQCNNLLMPNCNRNWCGLQDHQICAGKLAGDVDACQGDSGGPLQVKIPLPIEGQGSMHYLLGVTSFGIGCGLADMPGVYTRVSTFIDWIEEIVWK